MSQGAVQHPQTTQEGSTTEPNEAGAEWSLIDWYLDQQSQLSAVERFSEVHAELTAPTYRELLPAKPPGPGEQYAFEVNLDRCSGCKACVTACHSLNGLDDKESWREVGLLTGGTDQQPFMQHVTTACHHCLEPACMEVCPTLAYEKDSLTGIVKHLDDQCFGCQYCILACPYNVPKYNSRLGIVRKCDLCSQRLKVGEPSACVQACPHEAIRISIVSIDQIESDCETSQFLPGTPDPQYTLPTTNYRTSKPLPRNLIPADYFRVQTEHSHVSLVTMLVLTQLAVGGMTLGTRLPESIRSIQYLVSLGFCYLALTASLMHLGRPWLAYRAILGLRRSWLSREILAFGVFSGAATFLAARQIRPELVPDLGVSRSWLETITVVSGLLGVYCSAMIYHRTKRPFWNVYQSGSRFLLTSTLLGLAVGWVSALIGEAAFQIPIGDEIVRMLKWGVLTTGVLKGILEVGALVPLSDRPQTPLKRSALLLIGPLRREFKIRFALLLLGGVCLTGYSLNERSVAFTAMQELWCSILVLVTLIGGELLERSLFFKASVAFRMPGGPAA